MEKVVNDTMLQAEPVKAISQTETQVSTNPKKVCNENGSNIMPSEESKISSIKHPGNGLISREIIPPFKSSEGKPRGRKRKHLKLPNDIGESKTETKNLTKRLKLQKLHTQQSPVPSSNAQPQMAAIAKDIIQNPDHKEMKEVQLQISENGVMSARRVNSPGAEEKIILNSVATLTSPNSSNPSPSTSQKSGNAEKLLLSGNFNAKKTGPSGVTEIICNDKPDPSCIKKPTAARPGYVTLNIPNPGNPMLHNNRFQNPDLGCKTPNKVKKKANGLSPIASDIGISSGKTFEPQPFTKSNLMEKIKTHIASKATDGENVIKAITDLGKLCNGSIGNSGSGDAAEVQTILGTHTTTPISSTLVNQFQVHHRPKGSNGLVKTSVGGFPLGLNFSPASGMSVSMIPCTGTMTKTDRSPSTSCSSAVISALQTTTSPKRPASHQTTVINGDLKFTTSPKQVIAQLTTNGAQDGSPKRPPKFFKSRHALSPGTSAPTSSVDTNSTSPRQDNELKRKLPTTNKSKLSWSSKPSKLQPKRKPDPEPSKVRSRDKKDPSKTSSPTIASALKTQLGTQLGNNSSTSSLAQIGAFNGEQGSYPLAYQSSMNEKYSQHLNALNCLAASSAESSFGMAAAAAVAAAASSNVNGLPLGMVPFVTDNYCSMPFLNQIRHPLTQYDLLMNFPGVALANMGQLGQAAAATTANINVSKSITPSTSIGTQSRILNDLLTVKTATPESSNGVTLDLTVGKDKSSHNDAAGEANQRDNTTPLLARLLFNTDSINNDDRSKPVSPSISKVHAKEERASDPPTYKHYNGHHKGNINSQVATTEKLNGTSTSPEKVSLNNLKRDRLEKIITNGISPRERQASVSPNHTSVSEKKAETSMKANGESEINHDSGCSSNNDMSLAKEKLLCLSAQNNNNNNNHEADSSGESLKTTVECANKESDEKGSSTSDSAKVTELASKSD